MKQRTVTMQITLDLRAVALLSVLLLLLGFIILPAAAGAFPRSDDPEPQAYDAQNADRVDNHHAGPSSGTKAQRANRVLWATKQGKLHWRAMPASQLNARYLNDDRQEFIKAAVTGGPLLYVVNTGKGTYVYGLVGEGEDRGVYGQSSSGTGVYGHSHSGTAVEGYSYSGLPLKAVGYSGANLIEAWEWTNNLRFKVTRLGHVYADGTFHSYGADFAEMMATSEGVTYEPGDLLIIGPDGKPLPSSLPNATNLLGVYSSNPGFVGGVDDDGETKDKIPVAITGIVPLKVSAENGAIQPGDLLTSSSLPGHAMKASPVDIDGITFYLPGTILGKALETLEEGTGVILALVTLQ